MGLMERDILNIRSSAGVIILGGGIGTLNEFTVAYEEGKVVGVLLGTGGIANYIPEILEMCGRKVNQNLIFDGNPKSLVKKVHKAILKEQGAKYQDQRITGERKKSDQK